MSMGFDEVKFYYKDILEKESICKNVSIPITDVEDYLSAIYEEIEDRNFSIYNKRASEILEIEPNQLRELIFDVLYSNLYCDILLILQNMCGNKSRIRHEVFLTSVEYNDELGIEVTQNCRERFRRRMQPNRLNLVKKFKMKSSDEECFYSPSLIRAFKETLLVKRPGTEIMDISQSYSDIFLSLMFESDEEAANVELKNSKDIIKSYRLWKLNADSASFILNMYQTVLDSPLNGDEFAQLMLLEKLFGVYTATELLVHKKESTHILATISPMCSLGYCSLHRVLSKKVSEDNNRKFREIIYEYLHPFCVCVLTEISKSILGYIESADEQQSIELLKNILTVCKKNIDSAFSNNTISYLRTIPFDKAIEVTKSITGVSEVKNVYNMKKYISSHYPKAFTTRFYDSKYKYEFKNKRLFDKSFVDLTYTIKKQPVNKNPFNIFSPFSNRR